MKVCILVNYADLLSEFLGKLAYQILKEGDECIVVFNSRVAEYSKKAYFPLNAKFFSKVDWLINNFDEKKNDFYDVSWKEFFPTYERKLGFLNFDYKKSLTVTNQLCQFFDFLYSVEKPDMVLNEAPANIFTEVASHFCKKYDIKYFGLIGSRFNERMDLYDLEHTNSKYKKFFDAQNLISKEDYLFAQDFLKEFLSHEYLPPYINFQMKFVRFGNLSNYLRRTRKMLRYWINYVFSRNGQWETDYETEAVFQYSLRHPFHAVKREIRKIIYQNIFDRPAGGDKYFLFPLHLQPESSTSVLATYYSDQLNTVRNVAFSLPFPYKLYVKEHPVAVGTRVGAFYKKLKQIPNVVLIAPSENVENLIKKSQGVITLTSTVGLEAALSGKPVYALGEVFYSYHPFCRKVSGFYELKKKIESDILENPVVQNLEGVNIAFILSYFKNTINGDVEDALKRQDQNDYKEIYESIKSFFQSRFTPE